VAEQKQRPASLVSFLLGPDRPKLSALYDAADHRPYLNQCFNIGQGLGAGFFGQVRRCTDKSSGTEWAVKCGRLCFHDARDRLKQLREVQNIDALPQHTNIIRMLYSWEEQVIFFLDNLFYFDSVFFQANL
jgi:serine/threonine protein kinase